MPEYLCPWSTRAVSPGNCCPKARLRASERAPFGQMGNCCPKARMEPLLSRPPVTKGGDTLPCRRPVMPDIRPFCVRRKGKRPLCIVYRLMSESLPLMAKKIASEMMVVSVRMDASAPAVPNSVLATYWYTVTDIVIVWLV